MIHIKPYVTEEGVLVEYFNIGAMNILPEDVTAKFYYELVDNLEDNNSVTADYIEMDQYEFHDWKNNNDQSIDWMVDWALEKLGLSKAE